MSEQRTCPTGKRIYWTQPLVNRAITRAAERGELPPMRHYRCSECGCWHLSRKTRHATNEADA